MIDWLSFGFGAGIAGIAAYFVGFWVGRSDRQEAGRAR